MSSVEIATRLGLALVGIATGGVAGIFAARWPRLPAMTNLSAGSPRTLVLGVGFGLLAGAAAALQANPLDGAWLAATAGVLAYIGLVDLRRFAIPLPGLAILAALIGLDLLRRGEPMERLATGVVVALVLETLRRLGRRQGLGLGDVLLGGLLGVMLGWRLAPLTIAAAALAPLAVQVATRRRGPTPFGFWLCLAGAVAAGWLSWAMAAAA
jgi:prepilin signal peptidase PulO-like enzyme (type II secretory pathway)